MTAEKADAIVIGAGLGGLTCAAILAKAGLRVLVLEKNQRVGGYAVSYTQRGHRFDIAVQALGGCHRGGVISNIIGEIHPEHDLEFLSCEPARAYYLGNPEDPWLQTGTGVDSVEILSRRFPGCRRALLECRRIWSGIYEELERIGRSESGKAAFEFSRAFPFLARYGNSTVREFLDSMGLPRKLQDLVAARAGYCMLPPERLSLVGFACAEMSFEQGAWVVKGGIGRLGRLLARAVERRGGAVKRRSKVTSIVVERGAVRGVRTQDGRRYHADLVALGSAVLPALEQSLEQPESLPHRYRQRLAAMELTGSYYIAYYRVPSQAVEGLFPNMEIREPLRSWGHPLSAGAYYVLIPSMVDSTASPHGSHCFCLSSPCPPRTILGKGRRLSCRRALEGAVSHRFPQLMGRLSFLFDLGPEQLASVTGNPWGSAYGWAQTPSQSGIRRLSLKTPISGLHLAGHWTMPGGGIAGVVTSGRLCAETMLAK